MKTALSQNNFSKTLAAGIVLLAIFSGGTASLWLVGGGEYSLLDCLYMTFITISTIGYGEVVDLSSNPTGRIIIIFIAMSGIGVMTYILVNVTAMVIEGQLNAALRRKRMEKAVERIQDHLIVCGTAGVGGYIIEELRDTGRPMVAVEIDEGKAEQSMEGFAGLATIRGDATDSETLEKAGIKRAQGLFAVTGDDNQNLVITLTAKQLNPSVRVVARCESVKNVEKMRKVGADSIVSPTSIGGLRMASEMIRPMVVSFLDVMLRQQSSALRIEEVAIPPAAAGRPLSSLPLKKFRHLLLLALRRDERWIPNPPREEIMKEGDILIFMASLEERMELEKAFF